MLEALLEDGAGGELCEPRPAQVVKLRSSQGDVFEVEQQVACMSTLIQNMVEDDGTEEEIPLPNVKTATLHKVIDYCKHHRGASPQELQRPLASASLTECGVSEWDTEYV